MCQQRQMSDQTKIIILVVVIGTAVGAVTVTLYLMYLRRRFKRQKANDSSINYYAKHLQKMQGN